jgi:hypothetical protein
MVTLTFDYVLTAKMAPQTLQLCQMVRPFIYTVRVWWLHACTCDLLCIICACVEYTQPLLLLLAPQKLQLCSDGETIKDLHFFYSSTVLFHNAL